MGPKFVKVLSTSTKFDGSSGDRASGCNLKASLQGSQLGAQAEYELWLDTTADATNAKKDFWHNPAKFQVNTTHAKSDADVSSD